MDNDESDDEQAQESQELIPTEQDIIIFNGKPLVVVRLPDGKPGVVLRWICENLHIGQKAQVERIKRTEVIAGDLVYVQVQTGGGFQTMPTLVLDSVPYWLATIDTRRMEKDDPKRLEILGISIIEARSSSGGGSNHRSGDGGPMHERSGDAILPQV